MTPVLTYTLLRFALFAATLGLLYLAGARGLLLLALAVLVSGLISLVLLMRQRDAVSGVLVQRVERTRRRFRAAQAREDAWDDEQRRRSAAERPPDA
jgi:Protein of unknown function (DUF4229)